MGSSFASLGENISTSLYLQVMVALLLGGVKLN